MKIIRNVINMPSCVTYQPYLRYLIYLFTLENVFLSLAKHLDQWSLILRLRKDFRR